MTGDIFHINMVLRISGKYRSAYVIVHCSLFDSPIHPLTGERCCLAQGVQTSMTLSVLGVKRSTKVIRYHASGARARTHQYS
jgi:hypothetical protein